MLSLAGLAIGALAGLVLAFARKGNTLDKLHHMAVCGIVGGLIGLVAGILTS